MKGLGRTVKDLRMVSYFSKGRRWLILCFCILLALIIWLFQTLNGTYTKVMTLEIAPIQIPSKYSIESYAELPRAITIEVTSTGNKLLAFTLSNQLFQKPPKIELEIDSARLNPEGGYWSASGVEIIRQIRHSFPALDESFTFTIDRIAIRPDYIGFSYAPMEERLFPIVFSSQIDFDGSDNRFLKSWRMNQEEVMVYGTRSKLDSLSNITGVILTDTTYLKLNNIGINTQKVALLSPDGITLANDSVKVELMVQELRYYSFQSHDLKVRNLPEGISIRLFPSQTKITYLAEENIDQNKVKNELDLFIDLDELVDNPNTTKKLKINFSKLPKEVHMIQLEPDQVEFILEEKGK